MSRSSARSKGTQGHGSTSDKVRVRTRRPQKRTRTVLVALMAVVLVSVGAFALLSKNGGTTGGRQQQPSAGLDGVSDSDAAQAAVDALTSVLAAAHTGHEKGDVKSRLYRLEEGDTTVTDTAGVDAGVHYTGDFAKSEGIRKSLYQTLVMTADTLSHDGAAPEPSATAAHGVFLDREAGLAYVPLGAYSSSEAGFSVTMVHVGGRWLLEPYPLLDTVRLSAALASKNSTGAGGAQSGQ